MTLHDKIIALLNQWRIDDELDTDAIFANIEWRVSSRYQLLYVLAHTVKHRTINERKSLRLGRCQMTDTLWRDCVGHVYGDVIADWYEGLRQ